ncbi:uncharacterized protein THITE_2106235 [Thermothielavioides terrestris NRRL 8126]|jgi:hypothetical protein|uniref:RlpA-like protein double-psi beta-barrel domain-containing protein n=1 Tax=Thermothielavioides terrestris (strain ATCC 38088 / NRRL 8126) TaxID=578455 RepID=G2QWQ0_THETT|nr:uncharacterized protein THITE_2106235 [Thermothielavioides terrestris NRRL 8126]AEO62260.1 hypothetical protein THITE_2106235 [Thermothielavioides terrestris NRRL 8126]
MASPVVSSLLPIQASPSPSTSSPPAATSSSSSSGSGSSGSGSGSGGSTTYQGDITYYTLGLGSCGIDDTGKDNSANIVALSAALMGAVSNANPLCGKTITIKANGKTAQAVVHDKCPVCAFGDVDASQNLFLELFGSTDGGREKIEWWFN